MSQHPERTGDYLQHILGAIDRIQLYLSGKSKSDFTTDAILQDAVLRNLGIIGEAARKILADSPEFAALHPEIPWPKSMPLETGSFTTMKKSISTSFGISSRTTSQFSGRTSYLP